MNSLPKTVTQQRRDCDLNPVPSAPESSTLTTRLPSHRRVLLPVRFTRKLHKLPSTKGHCKGPRIEVRPTTLPSLLTLDGDLDLRPRRSIAASCDHGPPHIQGGPKQRGHRLMTIIRSNINRFTIFSPEDSLVNLQLNAY